MLTWGEAGVDEKITDYVDMGRGNHFGHRSSFIYYIIMKGAEGGGEWSGKIKAYVC